MSKCKRCKPGKHPCNSHAECFLSNPYTFRPSACSFCCQEYTDALSGKRAEAVGDWKKKLSNFRNNRKYRGKVPEPQCNLIWASKLDQQIFGYLKDPAIKKGESFPYFEKRYSRRMLETALATPDEVLAAIQQACGYTPATPSERSFSLGSLTPAPSGPAHPQGPDTSVNTNDSNSKVTF